MSKHTQHAGEDNKAEAVLAVFTVRLDEVPFEGFLVFTHTATRGWCECTRLMNGHYGGVDSCKRCRAKGFST